VAPDELADLPEETRLLRMVVGLVGDRQEVDVDLAPGDAHRERLEELRGAVAIEVGVEVDAVGAELDAPEVELLELAGIGLRQLRERRDRVEVFLCYAAHRARDGEASRP